MSNSMNNQKCVWLGDNGDDTALLVSYSMPKLRGYEWVCVGPYVDHCSKCIVMYVKDPTYQSESIRKCVPIECFECACNILQKSAFEMNHDAKLSHNFNRTNRSVCGDLVKERIKTRCVY
jgi:hypothetical protein